MRPPAWWEVNALALERADRRGVATFGPGELRGLLGISSSAVTRAVKACVRFDLLREGSGARVLILPSPDRKGVPSTGGGYPQQGGAPSRTGGPSHHGVIPITRALKPRPEHGHR